MQPTINDKHYTRTRRYTNSNLKYLTYRVNNNLQNSVTAIGSIVPSFEAYEETKFRYHPSKSYYSHSVTSSNAERVRTPMSFRSKDTGATRSHAGSNWLSYASILSSVQPHLEVPPTKGSIDPEFGNRKGKNTCRRRYCDRKNTDSRQNENFDGNLSQSEDGNVGNCIPMGLNNIGGSKPTRCAEAATGGSHGVDNRRSHFKHQSPSRLKQYDQLTISFGPSKSGRPYQRYKRDSASTESGSDESSLPRFRPPPRHRFVAMDCEMVGVGHRGSNDMLARVSIVNRNGDVLLDKYVSPQEHVTDYRTRISGIRPHNIKNGEDFDKVQDEVINILQGKVLVGHALRKDMEVLSIKHPPFNIRDTANYKPLANLVSNGRTPGLKKLTKVLFNQDIQVGEHSSVEDARAAMRIYDHFSEEWEAALLRNRYASRLRNNRSQQYQKMSKLKEQQKLRRQAQAIATSMPPAAQPPIPLAPDNDNDDKFKVTVVDQHGENKESRMTKEDDALEIKMRSSQLYSKTNSSNNYNKKDNNCNIKSFKNESWKPSKCNKNV